MTRRLFVACLFLVARFTAQAEADSAGAWMDFYAEALGIAGNVPSAGEWVEEVTATIHDPGRLAALGIPGAHRGETVLLSNHQNGYWTILLARSGFRKTVPLCYLVRFGVVPDEDLSTRKVPTAITGRVVAPEVLVQYEFQTAMSATRFVLTFQDGGWWLQLEPSQERRPVPF